MKRLKQYVERTDEVFSTDKLDRYILNNDDSLNSIRYFYQIRNNLTHRGKGVWKDFIKVQRSLIELNNILRDVLNETKDYCDKIRSEYES